MYNLDKEKKKKRNTEFKKVFLNHLSMDKVGMLTFHK